MKLKHAVLAIGLASLSSLVFAAGEHGKHGTHWGYQGELGPDNWTKLQPEFGACAGKNQSPIDVSGMIEAEMKPVRFDYKAGGHEVVNNGHTIQVNIEENGTPGPFTGFQPGQIGDFGESVVPAIPKKGIARILWTIITGILGLNAALRIAALHLAANSIRAQHVGDKKIDMTVAINVRTVNGH